MRPLSAFLLGWAGVIPFAALALATAAQWPLPGPAEFALRAYGVAILSFMGGAQWGLTMRAGDGSDQGWRGYAISVLPALVAWVAMLVPSRAGLILLATGFAALLAYDLWTVRQGYARDGRRLVADDQEALAVDAFHLEPVGAAPGTLRLAAVLR